MGFGEHTSLSLSQDLCAHDKVSVPEGVSMVLMVSVANKNGTRMLSARLSAHNEDRVSSEPRLPALHPALLGNSHASLGRLPSFSKM